MLTMDGIVCIFSIVRLTAATVEAEPMRRQPQKAHRVTFTTNIAPSSTVTAHGAIATAERALAVASTSGPRELVADIRTWLDNYRRKR